MPIRTRPSFHAALAAVLLATTAVHATDKANGTVVGKAVDSAGRANESVKITLMDGDKTLGTAYTDSDGKFTLSDVPPGKGYTIVAVRTVRVTTLNGKKADVNVTKGETTDVGNIELQLGNPE